MNTYVAVLIVLTKGQLLMQRTNNGAVDAFVGWQGESDMAVQAAVQLLDREVGLDVRPDDLEFLDAYIDDGTQTQVFIMAGVDLDRVHAYGGEDSLQQIQRSDDFDAVGLTRPARGYVIDYFKSHKK